MIVLSSNPSDKTIRAQVAESVSLIAELDFPEKWETLIDVRPASPSPSIYIPSNLTPQQLVSSLSPTHLTINIGVLETAHSIFLPWRAHVRSDGLFTEINFVLERFVGPFLALFRHTASLLLSSPAQNQTTEQEHQTQTMILLTDIYFDFTCQDLPPALEDAHEEFFHPVEGLFLRILGWGGVEAAGGDVSFVSVSFSSSFILLLLLISIFRWFFALIP